jgi:hypothetical protein
MRDNPYTDKKISKNAFLREFSELTEDDELVWHRDRNDRYVTVVEGDGWQLQFDNMLPVPLNKAKQFTYQRTLIIDYVKVRLIL